MTKTTNATHTPGRPQRYQDSSDLPATVMQWRGCVNDARGTMLADCRGRDSDGNETTEADAALLAAEIVRRWNALPDLLAACAGFIDKCILAKMDAGPDMIDGATWDDLEPIRAAIAKAKGGAA